MLNILMIEPSYRRAPLGAGAERPLEREDLWCILLPHHDVFSRLLVPQPSVRRAAFTQKNRSQQTAFDRLQRMRVVRSGLLSILLLVASRASASPHVCSSLQRSSGSNQISRKQHSAERRKLHFEFAPVRLIPLSFAA